MTDHMTNAVNAGKLALNALAIDQGAQDNPDQWHNESEAALDAMLPHLREMIAEEIRAEKISEEHAPNQDFREGVMLGMEHAAQIAKGPRE